MKSGHYLAIGFLSTLGCVATQRASAAIFAVDGSASITATDGDGVKFDVNGDGQADVFVSYAVATALPGSDTLTFSVLDGFDDGTTTGEPGFSIVDPEGRRQPIFGPLVLYAPGATIKSSTNGGFYDDGVPEDVAAFQTGTKDVGVEFSTEKGMDAGFNLLGDFSVTYNPGNPLADTVPTYTFSNFYFQSVPGSNLPEPSTVTVLGVAGAGLLTRRKRITVRG